MPPPSQPPSLPPILSYGSYATTIPAMRLWFRSDLVVLRWAMIGLYIAVVLGLFATWAFTGSAAILIMGLIIIAAQAFFVLGAGTMQLCRPIDKRRIVIPILFAAAAFTLLLFGLGLALTELFYLDKQIDLGPWVFFGMLAACWLAWGVLLWVYTRRWTRWQFLFRLSAALLAGSLAELIAVVPAHIIVSRRPGCLVGLSTALGIIAGLNVMFFSFGPAVVLLCLRPRLRRQLDPNLCQICGYDLRASENRCPECGTAFERMPTPAEG